MEKQLERQTTDLRVFFRKEENPIMRHAICNANDSTPLRLKGREIQTSHHAEAEKMQAWMEKQPHGRYAHEVN